MKLGPEQWKIWAVFYIVLVGVTATFNQLATGETVGWYFASLALTLPLSPFAIYPILFLAGVAADATGGDWNHGNTFSAAVVVASFVALALINVALVRGLVLLGLPRERTPANSAS